jgi:hypothetical protein
MKFNVPQFIEEEAKIIGPFTLKQFIYIGSAGVIIFILFYTLPFSLFLPAAIVLGLIAFGLAFLKINGKSLPETIVNLLKFLFSVRIFLWQKEKNKTPQKNKTEIFEKNSSAFKEELSKEGQLKKIETRINTN